MSHSEIIETRDKFRARITVDDYASEPDGDFFGTVYYLDRDGRCERKAAPFKSPDDFSDELRFGWEHYRDMKLVERYLRIWYGIRGFNYFDTQDGKYVNVVTDYDLNMWGWDLDPAEWPVVDGVRSTDPAKNNLDEWHAYHDGDVWLVRVEKCIHWTTDDDDADTSERDEWQEIDDTVVGGYYGEEWARQAATEALDDYAPRPCRKCGQPLKYDETQPAPMPWVHVDPPALETDHPADGHIL